VGWKPKRGLGNPRASPRLSENHSGMETRSVLLELAQNELSENQCGMETLRSVGRSTLGLVEREPMWDGNPGP